ncbi:hypothetical protein SAMN05192560_2314 [Methylobacillus rhizosphaerae]|uniref:Uncharacterized protein n=1 Tax=Methylobacillus rhizosphaerae TaxID=551994 RepID=A0A239B608_9PROT|nr:hypothetical protein [Methylobacillus rhizosphaerae]SNS03296.1 hypothetical protein SAMN05192560_2314 [Methylobacillus rhizosphaerae]
MGRLKRTRLRRNVQATEETSSELMTHFERWTTVIGVVITLFALGVSFMQYRVADLQAEAARIQIKPAIQVRALSIEDPTTRFMTDRKIIISNEGGPAYNFDFQQITWVELDSIKLPARNNKTIEKIVNSYFIASFPSELIKGELSTLIGIDNNKKMYETLIKINSLDTGWLMTQPKTIIKVNYEDSLKESTEEYFLISGNSVHRMRESHATSRWNKLKQLRDSREEFDLDLYQSEDKLKEWLGLLL